MSLVVFFIAAAGAIASALAVVLQRNPFISAIALIGHFASLATLYLLLQADFVAAAQVIVYAGAVMVMFLFVIAYIGPRGELADESSHHWQAWAAIIAGSAVLVEIILAVGTGDLGNAASAGKGFGSPQSIGELFLTKYLFSFELVSLMLLVAAIAAVVMGAGPRPPRVRLEAEATADERRRAASRALISVATGEEDRR